MRIFNFMQLGLLRPKKVGDKDTMLVPAGGEGMHPQVEHIEGGGNGNLIDSRLVIVREPYSIAAEQYRVLYTRISQLVQNKSTYTLAITSSVKDEGKTFTSLNLAIAMARDFDERVLLIEGDLKNPTLHEYLKRSPGFGLSDVLEGRIEFDSASIQLVEGRLSVLLAGKVVGSPLRLLASPKMEELLNSVKGYFKYIIIDTPPIIPVADINIYSTLVDGLLLVIQAGKTPKSMIKKALASMPSEKVIGAVLNEVEPNYSKYYYGTRYSY